MKKRALGGGALWLRSLHDTVQPRRQRGGKLGPSIAVTGDRRHQNESCEGRCAASRRQPRWSRGLGMEVRISRLTWAPGVTLFGAGWGGCCA